MRLIRPHDARAHGRAQHRFGVIQEVQVCGFVGGQGQSAADCAEQGREMRRRCLQTLGGGRHRSVVCAAAAAAAIVDVFVAVAVPSGFETGDDLRHGVFACLSPGACVGQSGISAG